MNRQESTVEVILFTVLLIGLFTLAFTYTGHEIIYNFIQLVK